VGDLNEHSACILIGNLKSIERKTFVKNKYHRTRSRTTDSVKIRFSPFPCRVHARTAIFANEAKSDRLETKITRQHVWYTLGSFLSIRRNYSLSLENLRSNIVHEIKTNLTDRGNVAVYTYTIWWWRIHDAKDHQRGPISHGIYDTIPIT